MTQELAGIDEGRRGHPHPQSPRTPQRDVGRDARRDAGGAAPAGRRRRRGRHRRSPAPAAGSAPGATSRPWPRGASSAAPRWRRRPRRCARDGGVALATRAAQADHRHGPRRGGRRRALAGAGLRPAHRRRLRALRDGLRARRLLGRLRRQLVPHPARRHRQGARALLHRRHPRRPASPRAQPGEPRRARRPARRADARRSPPGWPAALASPSAT